MRRAFTMFLAVCMFLALSLCTTWTGIAETAEGGRQVATAWLDQAGTEVGVTVDLSGGWSVEFAHGALYLYDGDYSEDKDATAIGQTLDQEVFEEYWTEAVSAESFRELDGSVYYKAEDETGVFLTQVGEDAYFMLRVMQDVDEDATFARVKVDRPVSGEVAAGISNPWTDTTADGLMEALGLEFTVPEGAENVCFRMLKDESLAEMDFDLDGMTYTARIQPDAEWTDISGMYYEWENTQEDITIGGRPAWEGRATDGEDTADLCLWFDAVPGLMYSLGTVGEGDLDGFDLTAIAEQIFTPVQGDA